MNATLIPDDSLVWGSLRLAPINKFTQLLIIYLSVYAWIQYQYLTVHVTVGLLPIDTTIGYHLFNHQIKITAKLKLFYANDRQEILNYK